MLGRLAWTKGLAALIIAALVGSPCRAAQLAQTDSTPLIRLATSKFPELTKAERALLEFADVGNLNRGEWAAAGPSQKPLDPTNDPARAASWAEARNIRAALIEWMAADHAALERVHAGGVRILGARIVGPLNLSNLRVPFGITMVRCSIPDQMRFEATEIPRLDFAGSHTGEIFAGDIQVNGSLYIGYDGHEYGDFAASGEVYVGGAKVDGDLGFNGSHFQSSKVSMEEWKTSQNVALDASDIEVGHLVMMVGAESTGAVLLTGARIGGDLGCPGGHFFNPNNVALDLTSARIDGNVFLALNSEPYRAFESDGAVNLIGTRIDGMFIVDNAKFHGKTGERHGMFAGGLVGGLFIWQHVDLENGATLDLSSASVHTLSDDVIPPQNLICTN
jgi:hypothetical protein